MAEQNTRRRYPWVLLWILALVFATAGGAVGGSLITSKDIKDRTIRNRDIAEGTIRNNRISPDGLMASAIGEGAIQASELGATQLVTDIKLIAANGTANHTVPCPAGTQVLSGGFTTSSYGVHFVSSFQSGNGWLVAAQNTTGSDQTITAVAICLTAPSVVARTDSGRPAGADPSAPPQP